MRICLIGSGNTATVLGKLCKHAGHVVVQVFGRNKDTAEKLAESLEAEAVLSWQQITRDADIYLIALPDNMLSNVHEYLRVTKGIVVHTAGSVSMEVLKEVAPNYGVLYPLQSLKTSESHIGKIPFLIDGNTIENKTLLMDFASTLSSIVSIANNEQRLYLHLAAVWVNNFSNYLFTEAWDICQEKGVDFNMLLPLMEHTVGRLKFSPPAAMQTGPSIRGDQNTIERHLNLLSGKPRAQELYRTLSEVIANYHKHI